MFPCRRRSPLTYRDSLMRSAKQGTLSFIAWGYYTQNGSSLSSVFSGYTDALPALSLYKRTCICYTNSIPYYCRCIMRRFVLLLVSLMLFVNVGFAEIACVCTSEHCICFIQLGDGGKAMESIQHALIEQGYLEQSDDAYRFDTNTLKAVLRFQEANSLPVTGMLDDNTLRCSYGTCCPRKWMRPILPGRPSGFRPTAGFAGTSGPVAAKCLMLAAYPSATPKRWALTLADSATVITRNYWIS